MKNSHIIQRQVFKIELDNHKNFKEVCEVIESLLRHELGEQLESILDEYNIPGQDIVINRLDIDLGKLDINNLKKSIQSSFISSFQKVLEEKLKYQGSHVKIVDKQTRDRTVFDFFIKNGSSPWWISTKSGNLKKEFTKFFYSRTYQTKSIWQKAQKNPVQYKRLLYNLDLELLIARWVSTKGSGFKIPQHSMVKAIIEIVAKQGQLLGDQAVATRVKSNIINDLFASSRSESRIGGPTETIKRLFDDNSIHRHEIEKVIRNIIRPSIANDRIKDKRKPNISSVTDGELDEIDIVDDFLHFLKYGYPLDRHGKSNFRSITSMFDHLVMTDLTRLQALLKYHGKSIRIRQRFLNQISQDSISLFFTRIAPDKKELFEWIHQLYIPSEEVLKPINQTNIRVQKSVNEVILEIFIQQNINNLSSESFLRMHFKKMALRYNIRYNELLRFVVKIVNERKSKVNNEAKFIAIIEKLYDNSSGKKISYGQEFLDEEDLEPAITHEKKDVPDQLLNQIPRDVIKELMNLKNTGILGKSTIIIQHLISAYIRHVDRSKKRISTDPKDLIKKIADFFEVDKGFLEFGIIFNAKKQRENNVFVSQESILFGQLSNSPIFTALTSREDMNIMVRHFLLYKNLYDLSHIKKIFNKKILFERIEKKSFRQFMKLIFGDQHKELADFIIGINITGAKEERKKIENQVYATFVHETLSIGTGDFNIKKVFSKINILLKGHIEKPIETPTAIVDKIGLFVEKAKKSTSRKKSSKANYIKEKNLLALYHILDLDLVLENAGSNFFDNIIFSFDLLLTKHRQEFIDILFQNRFNRELAYFLSYQDEAGLLHQIEKIFSSNKVERINKTLDAATKVLSKLNWLRMNREDIKKYVSMFIYPSLFSQSTDFTNFHDFIYEIVESAEREKILSNDFYNLFGQENESAIKTKIGEIIGKDILPVELNHDKDSSISLIRIKEFDALSKKSAEDSDNLYYFELLSTILENLRFPEGHVFYGQPWNENRDYINRVLKKFPTVLGKTLKKKLPISQQEILLELLDNDLLRTAISISNSLGTQEFERISEYWLKKVRLKAGFDERGFLERLFRKAYSNGKKSKDLQRDIASILSSMKMVHPWDILEILYDSSHTPEDISSNIRIEDYFRNMDVNSDTWTDSYFKMLSSRKYGNVKAYKVINYWLPFLFSPLIHKTEKQAFIFIYTVYFKFSFWKIRDPIEMHSILVNELGVFESKDKHLLISLVRAMRIYGIPSKAILRSAEKYNTIDDTVISEITGSSSDQFPDKELAQKKPFSGAIMTPEQFSNTLLFDDSRNEKAAKLFHHWMETKKWTDVELSGLYKILSLPVILRELYLMSESVDLEKILGKWSVILEKLDISTDSSRRYRILINIILKYNLWKFKMEELIHVHILKSLQILNNRDRSDIIKILTILTEYKIPLANYPRLKELGFSIQGPYIKNIVEQYNFSHTDPRPVEPDVDQPSEEESEVQLEEDIIFFMQSGYLSNYEGELNEKEKSVISALHEKGISNFLDFENLHPDSLSQFLLVFSKEDSKKYIIDGFKDIINDEGVINFFGEAIDDFFDQADSKSIIRIIKEFHEIGKMRTLSAESRLDLLLRAISRVRQMESSISKTLQLHKKTGLSKVKFLKSLIKESMEKEENVVTDVEKIFIYFLEYGLIMPNSFIVSLQELKTTLLNYIRSNPASVRYLLHIKSNVQKSRKRIIQMMRTGMSSEILAIIHPELKKDLHLLEEMMSTHFNINIWEVLGKENDSARWDHILFLWSGINSKIKDPIEILELLLKAVLKDMDDSTIEQIQRFDPLRFSISERSIWKGLVALIPELKRVPADKKRKLKLPDEVKNTAEQAEREQEIMDPEEGITVYNAGLVLLWPYLSRYFSLLELANAQDFLGEPERARAIQLTQYLVTGSKEMEEWNLSLNKILCGAELNFPVETTLDITLEEEELSNKMLKGALQNWPKLKNTKPSSFQETFLRREGRLYKRDNRWELIVEKKAYDMLLNSLPWNISMIKLNWMPERLVVVWN